MSRITDIVGTLRSTFRIARGYFSAAGLTAARTLSFPDKSGTLALTSDVTGRNRIINGDFRVNQRGYTSGAATTAGQYTLDRWKVTSTGGITYATTNNKTTVTIPSGQTLQQVVEGINLQSGTYVLSWEGTAQGRIAGGSYGASGAVTAAIVGGTNTTIEFGPGTVANVQLEAGATATPFEYRHFGAELALCQRYYEVGGAASFVLVSNVAGRYPSRGFMVPKRATPTITLLQLAGSGATLVIDTTGFYQTTNHSFDVACAWTASAEL